MRRLALASVLLLLAGCTSDGGDQGGGEAAATPTSSAPTSEAPPTASAAPTPLDRGCYDLTFDEAVAPTAPAQRISCNRPHTAMTYAVGTIDALVGGHLLAVDSDRVQEQVAEACPARFGSFVGGSLEDQRLSMLRPVWFTPSVEESDAGASWFRCDVVALASDEELAPLTGRLAGVLDSDAGRERYGMCGTAQPGSADFSRVVCSAKHAWRAIAVVPFEAGRYPGVAEVRGAGETPCQDAGASAASGSLDYEWGYEWPSKQQWAAGQTFGRCWAPD